MVTLLALHRFMTNTGEIIEKGQIFEHKLDDEVQLWLRHKLVEIAPEKKSRTRKKKS